MTDWGFRVDDSPCVTSENHPIAPQRAHGISEPSHGLRELSGPRAMTARARAIETYIRAKDENRPHLLPKAFAEGATVRMHVHTAAISFPPILSGLDAIADALVRRFGQTYENVYTFCLSAPPDDGHRRFSCRWLVAMSDKQTGMVRVGAGLYDWDIPHDRIEELQITITAMQILDSRSLHPVMNWLSGLPYPWCPAEVALRSVPEFEGLRALLNG
jgi:hypothetical protein